MLRFKIPYFQDVDGRWKPILYFVACGTFWFTAISVALVDHWHLLSLIYPGLETTAPRADVT
jgi:hypothetical protein